MSTKKDIIRGPALDPARWVEAHGDILYRYALLRTGRPDLAEDLVQETFLAALRARDGFEGRSSERTWLIGILRHKIAEQFRRPEPHQASDSALEDPPQTSDPFDRTGHWNPIPASWKGSPDAELGRREFWTVLRNCMSHLADALADAFILRELEAMSTEEICRKLDISATGLWSRLHRARLQLRRCLENNWFKDRPGES